MIPFSGKIRKIFKNADCRKCYPVFLSLNGFLSRCLERFLHCYIQGVQLF